MCLKPEKGLMLPLFQNLICFSFDLSQTFLTLTMFIEKYLTFTILNKCTIKTYFMVDLMKLIWCCDVGAFLYKHGQSKRSLT
jgi:hypothetical protein